MGKSSLCMLHLKVVLRCQPSICWQLPNSDLLTIKVGFYLICVRGVVQYFYFIICKQCLIVIIIDTLTLPRGATQLTPPGNEKNAEQNSRTRFVCLKCIWITCSACETKTDTEMKADTLNILQNVNVSLYIRCHPLNIQCFDKIKNLFY